MENKTKFNEQAQNYISANTDLDTFDTQSYFDFIPNNFIVPYIRFYSG